MPLGDDFKLNEIRANRKDIDWEKIGKGENETTLYQIKIPNILLYDDDIEIPIYTFIKYEKSESNLDLYSIYLLVFGCLKPNI